MGKFKSMKKVYQVIILLGIIAIIFFAVSLLLLKTPFDGIKAFPPIDTAIQRYGQEYTTRRDAIVYNPYKWLGYDGELLLFNENGHCASAMWQLKTSNPDAAYAKMAKLLNIKLGKRDDGGSTYSDWHTSSGATYHLSKSGNTIYFQYY